jgi:cell pole-organizing protein PopZ
LRARFVSDSLFKAQGGRFGGESSSPGNRGKLGVDLEAAPHGAEVNRMNAPNPSPGEREFDAMRRAQRTHEPSMEEILASIRAIIADDREAELPKASLRAVSNTPSRAEYRPDDSAAVGEVQTAPAQVEDLALIDPPSTTEVTSLSRRAPPISQAHDREDSSAVGARPEIEPAVAPTPEREIACIPQEPFDPPLLSEAADRAVTASFEELSSSLALHNSELIEGLTRELLRPMIQKWLDENLPSLVERLVRAEIQRVARGGR